MLVPIVLFSLTFAVAGYFSQFGVDPYHDGLMFKSAFDVAGGSMLFRDTFTQYGALTTLLQAFALLLFGKYLLTIQLLTAFFYGLIAVLLYILYRKILPSFLSGLTVLLWICIAPYIFLHFHPWASVYALFFQLLGTYLLVISEQRANPWYLVWSGIVTALVFFSKQPVGACMLIAIYMYFIYMFVIGSVPFKKCIRSIYLFTCGVVFTSSCFIIWIASNGAFRDFWLQSIKFAFLQGTDRNESTISGALSALFPGGGYPISLWTILPVVTILTGIACSVMLILKKNVHQTKTVLIIAAIGLSAWNQYFPLNDDRHTYWGATQMFGLLTLVLFIISRYISKVFPKYRNTLTTALTCFLLVCLFYPYITLRISGGILRLKASYVTVSHPDILRGMKVSLSDAQFYSFVSDAMTAYFQKNPDGNVLNISGDALYGAFDPRIHNIHPLHVVWYQMYNVYQDFPPLFDAYLQTHKPLVVTNGKTWFPEHYCELNTPSNADNILISLPCENK